MSVLSQLSGLLQTFKLICLAPQDRLYRCTYSVCVCVSKYVCECITFTLEFLWFYCAHLSFGSMCSLFLVEGVDTTKKGTEFLCFPGWQYSGREAAMPVCRYKNRRTPCFCPFI